jgi:hypothetical protein
MPHVDSLGQHGHGWQRTDGKFKAVITREVKAEVAPEPEEDVYKPEALPEPKHAKVEHKDV